ncbi:MAG: TerD family protein [bacterium]
MSVSLQKGQRISLKKESGDSLTKVVMGIGWDAKKTGGVLGFLFGDTGGSIDLDASCILFDEANHMTDAVWFKQLKSHDGSIIHTGDNRTGDGDGDDEQIIVNLSAIPATVNTLMFVVNNFTGQSFNKVENAYCRIINAVNNKEIAKYNLNCNGNHTAMIMAKIYRHDNEWKIHAIGESADGRTFQDIMPAMSPYL